MSDSRPRCEPIAVVGSACRFAGAASSPSKLWKILQDPRDLNRLIPESRFSHEAFYHPEGLYHGHTNVRRAYLLDEDPATFDATFFGIKPAEARAMDPQQRFLLEVVFESLESAGVPIARLRGSDTAVYVGTMFDDYGALLLRDLQDLPTYYATGTARSILANRVSYFYDWHGPSVSVDTACSSSLVAIHMAVQALRAGESRTALACGANLILGPEGCIVESKLGMLSPDGRGRMWDQGANGYARGEGVAAIVLKTLGAAVQDGDHIECIIRETGLNTDGATPGGLTMPSSTAQEALIRSTYARAGLDVTVADDQPQYFEAHGTGTPAGDPKEAEAIHNVFGASRPQHAHPLYVGSIKTVLGHTEGTAGIAAILKASLALQHACVPPNMLFDQLSDQVAPFYRNVEILRTAKPWPGTAGVRRASVNSFGFGGGNAHCILESYGGKSSVNGTSPQKPYVFTPFVFSAVSETSLCAMLSDYLAFLEAEGEDVDPHNLAWVLRQRRSTFSWRASFSATSVEHLRVKLRGTLEKEPSVIGIKAPSDSTRLVGVFTGQGAQYARMGAEIMEHSEMALHTIKRLESYLAEIPESERPSWSLLAEILAGPPESRVQEAAISQPLCTAIQILLVDMLRAAGVQLAAVIGHSSGEIGAAYAAGYLSARGAMYVSYFRGLHAERAGRGAMLAVGTTSEDAAELCADKAFAGRISLAAVNSPSSVTISGDEEAIVQLQDILDDEKKFHRRLRVDKAYHSPQMLACVEPYMTSLRQCGVSLQTPGPNHPTWHSSVFDMTVSPDTPLLDNTYWADNMVRPVLFSQAVERAVTGNSSCLMLEIGPHPALQGPASQTAEQVLGKEVPYSGLLSRETDAVEASSAALGFLWSHLGSEHIDLENYQRAVSGQSHGFEMIKGLPSYPWDHHTKYWHESRTSRQLRLRRRPVHPLLGDISTDSSPHHMSWRNLLRVGEIEWLSGHQVQSQIVFPMAGYLSTAFEAAKILAEDAGENIRLIEIRDFEVHQAVILDQEDRGVEVLVSMADITRRQPDRVRARFTYSTAVASQTTQGLTLAASGAVEIILGTPEPSLLPQRKPETPHMIDVEPERFYAALYDLGYMFSDNFRSLNSLKRKNAKASCLVRMNPTEYARDVQLLVDPVDLDGALQSIILAHSYPYDEKLRILHLPTTIKLVRLNPALCLKSKDKLMPVDANIVPRKAGQRGIVGHVNVYNNQSPHAAIQVQAGAFIPLTEATPEQDRRVFSKVSWVDHQPDGLQAASGIELTKAHMETTRLLERISIYYLRKIECEVPEAHPKRSEFPTSSYLNFARHITSLVEAGKHKWAEPAWLHDSIHDISEASKPFAHLPDVEIMHIVGTQMPRVIRGETTILEAFRANGNDVLDRYYAGGFGLRETGRWVAQSLKQIVDRYPHMNILELGAGTGGATKTIFDEIGSSFASYTYTDISAAFFKTASEIFSQHSEGMVFKKLDAERDPSEQGFQNGAYDVVVAYFVLHATSDLGRCLRNARKLLRPGGFLVVGEGLEDGTNGIASMGFIFGTLPGWWLGSDTGRTLSPHVTPMEWHELLRSNGFSGVDSCPPTAMNDSLSTFPFVSQAVNEEVEFLRVPLAPSSWRPPPMPTLIIVGGQTACTSRLVRGLHEIFGNGKIAGFVHSFETLLDVDYSLISASSTVVSLSELDHPVFRDITPQLFEALKSMFGNGKTLLWLTRGRLDEEPFSNMTVGFGRVAANEVPDLRLQQLDVADPKGLNPHTIAEILMRLQVVDSVGVDLLWSVEPEIVIDTNQRQLLARLQPVFELNDRYNSTNRNIFHEMDIEASSMILEPHSSGYVARELSRYETARGGSERNVIELRTTYSVLSALKTTMAHQFLILGVESQSKQRWLALVPSLASVQRIPVESAVALPEDKSTVTSVPDLLRMMAAHLIAMAILQSVSIGQTLMVHNATRPVAAALSTQAATKGVHVVFTTDLADDNEKAVPGSWIKLPRNSSQYDLEEILQLVNPTAFVGLSSHDETSRASENESTMLGILGQHQSKCPIIMTANTLYSESGYEGTAVLSPAVLGQALSKCLGHALEEMQAGVCHDQAEPIGLDSLLRGSTRPSDPLCIIDWSVTSLVPIRTSKLDISSMFSGGDSTYWIVGMTGALGLSLADWMISKGATNIVLTSRNPDISPDWVASHARRGANVAVLACDVTDEAALTSVHHKICEDMPPIAGVINGAMVLRDTSIRNMTFNQLTDVLGPKVQGSLYLDRIFHAVGLDFFVLVSSINCVIGNWGQANYAAANTFMCSLAANRRKRGLRASVVNGGAIVGAGYMERSSRRALDQIVQKLHMMPLSEDDWCASICEAVDASRLDSPHGPELSTGLSDVPFDAPNAPLWYSNPKFSSFIVRQKASGADGGGGDSSAGSSSVPVADRLRTCTTRPDALLVVREAFAAQLRGVLQIDTSDDDLMASRSNEIGLDSLVSVDVASWFRNKLQISVPVLKIMSNEPMAALVDYAVEQMSKDMLSGLEQEDGIAHAKELKGDETEELSWTASDGERNGGSGLIDWEAESRPPADVPSLLRSPDASLSPPVRTPPRVIVLTGVTGLLGRHLLDHLLSRIEVTKVICLAVRRLSSRLQTGELPQDDAGRIVYCKGELSQPLLGLTEDQAASVFAEADAVIHNGADTSHLKSYTSLRPSNVGSTAALVRLCVPRRTPLHYVSSAGVSVLYSVGQGRNNGAGNAPVFPEVSVAATPPTPELASFGYMCSKWVNERLLERVVEQSESEVGPGFRVSIHRPSTILREEGTRDAEGARAGLDWVNSLLRYVRVLRAVPRVVNNTAGALDLVRVESVCEDILKEVFFRSDGYDGIKYMHEVGDVVVPLEGMQECEYLLSGLSGDEQLKDHGHTKKRELGVLEMREWLDRAMAAGMHPAVAALVEVMDEMGAPPYPKLLKEGWGGTVDGESAASAGGEACPTI